jgi:hypothetical protein
MALFYRQELESEPKYARHVRSLDSQIHTFMHDCMGTPRFRIPVLPFVALAHRSGLSPAFSCWAWASNDFLIGSRCGPDHPSNNPKI